MSKKKKTKNKSRSFDSLEFRTIVRYTNEHVPNKNESVGEMCPRVSDKSPATFMTHEYH